MVRSVVREQNRGGVAQAGIVERAATFSLRIKMRVLLLALMAWPLSVSATTPVAGHIAKANRNTADIHGSVAATARQNQIHSPVSAGAMKCDGVTDDTAALTAALSAAAANKNALVQVPMGTCIIGSVGIPDNIHLSGAGKYASTLKTRSGLNGLMLTFSGMGTNIAITDITLDGNKGGQSTEGQLVSPNLASRAASDITLQRVRFQNAWRFAYNDIGANAGNGGPTNIRILDCDFIGNGTDDGSSVVFGDILLAAPSNTVMSRNFFSGTGGNAIMIGPRPGAKQQYVEITNNIITGALGFGVALGGGNNVNEHIQIAHNKFYMPASIQNIIDLGEAAQVVVDENVIVMSTLAAGCGGIADAPNSTGITVTNNRVFGAPGTLNLGYGISLGGIDSVISGNYVSYAGGSGIGIAPALNTTATNVVIAENVVKNSSQASANKVGIELYLTPGTGNVRNIQIHDNELFDDQKSRTQNYGIGLAIVGQATGFRDIAIHDNKLRHNKIGAILNNLSAPSNLRIYNNLAGEAEATGSKTPARQPRAQHVTIP
jgi:Pectate lyase superfamily protein